MNIENVVTVDIAISKALVNQKNFGRGMILGTTQNFSERFRIYGSLEDVAVDYAVSDPEYLAALAYFSPAIAPVDLMIGRGDVEVKQVDDIDDSALAAIVYTVTVNGNPATVDYSGGAPADKTTLFTALQAAVDSLTDPTIVTSLVGAGANKTLRLTSSDFSKSFTTTVGTDLTLTHTTAYLGVDTNLTAITSVAGGSDWYGLIQISRNVGDIMGAVAWVEAASGKYIYIACNDDADVLTGVSTDVASLIMAGNYARSDFFWSDDQANFPEAVWFGTMLPKDPGSATYALKTLTGITASEPTSNEVANLIAKRASYYVTIGGVDVTQGSMTGDGDFIDIQVGVDWMVATMEQNIYALLASTDKVPFTDEGIQLIGNIIKSVLKQAVDPQQVLVSFETDFPLASSYSANQKATRVLNNLKFTGVLAGAVHKVNVQGNVSF